MRVASLPPSLSFCSQPYIFKSVSYREAKRSTEGVDEYHGEEHEEGDSEEGDLAPFFQFASEDNGVETALLEARSIVPMVMMMVVFGH